MVSFPLRVPLHEGCQSNYVSTPLGERLGKNKGTINDLLFDSAALQLFLQKSRENAARSYEERVALLESHYVRRLEERSRVLHATGVGETARGCAHDDVASAASDVSFIEIELGESDGDMSLVEDHPNFDTKRGAWLHSSPVSPSPQKSFDPDGMSPEVHTPLFLSEEKTPSLTAATDPVCIVMDPHSMSKKTAICVVTPIVSEFGESSTAAPAHRLSRDKAPPAALQHVPSDVEVEREVTRSLLGCFGNHLETSERKGMPQTLEAPSSNIPLEPELQEFLEWEAAKHIRRCQALQVAPSRSSFLAKVYAAAQPDLRLSSLLTGGPVRPVKLPVVPDSAPSRFIEWIASDVDCYEDLLLHLSPASEAAEKWVVEAVCDVIVEHFVGECVLDCILSAQR